MAVDTDPGPHWSHKDPGAWAQVGFQAIGQQQHKVRPKKILKVKELDSNSHNIQHGLTCKSSWFLQQSPLSETG